MRPCRPRPYTIAFIHSFAHSFIWASRVHTHGAPPPALLPTARISNVPTPQRLNVHRFGALSLLSIMRIMRPSRVCTHTHTHTHTAAPPTARLPSLRSNPAPPAQTFIIDRTGEMPQGTASVTVPAAPVPIAPQPHRPTGASAGYRNGSRSRSATPSRVLTAAGGGGASAAPMPPSRFPAYDLDADEPRPSTPEAIKVTKVKKKKGSGGGGGEKRTKKRTTTRPDDTY